MKLTVFTALAASAAALNIPKRDAQTLYTIELAPGQTQQVTQEEKWALRAQGKNFIDITNHPTLNVASTNEQAANVTFPSSITHQEAVKTLLSHLSTSNLEANLKPFTEFQNRFYNSTYGAQSSAWLLSTVQDIISESGAAGASAAAFAHDWAQTSVIATIPGNSRKIIVLGAHQDSINQQGNDVVEDRAPGADDDGSGSITILEAMRVLLSDPDIAAGKAPNTVEFHWYSAEEEGLLGSQDIFEKYKEEQKDVKAMLQQDMTGYVEGTLNAGKPEQVGVITDYVDTGLVEFIKKVVTEYCDIPYVETECGYACSDHASSSKAGYPSSFVFESEFGDHSPFIHTARDTLDTVSYEHMLQHAKLTVGFAYELAYASDL
ncbi:Zn-dependent exopeptidase [Trematosphaeria pertusa]|uniref:Peptide hydrolase n=1 Tax=Trematosphaeria pertusa TaxID=390896 RepID=A0A6A6IAX9_9PLEO|nr:Zn-dependent exopeptidase [Trematosphaeria pertusa]KAF2247399.1 Zn-dependent exopeptidase [Trematosphaeria pertusa]